MLNDPGYLNTFDINLGSIENLLIRRKRSVQKGKENFSNEDFLNEWVIYPNFEISDLGNHINACFVPILSWQGVNLFTQEDERFEFEEFDPVFGTITSTESLSDNISIFIQNTSSEYIPEDPQANSLDFNTPIDPSVNLTLGVGSSANTFELLTTVVDSENEGDEGTGFQFDIVDANGTGAMVEFNGDIFDIKIKEMLSNTSNIEFSSTFDVYPTIVSDLLTIKSTIPELKILKVRFVAFNGKNIKEFELSASNHATVNLSSINSSGYHILYIYTNKGTAVKKIFKF